mgnify:FL=1
MQIRIDSDTGRRMITRRFATVQPASDNLRGNNQLNRFARRGKAKVDSRWTLYYMLHFIEKLAQPS